METRSPEKNVTVQDAGKVFSWLNTRTDMHAVSVDLPSLYIRNIQNKKSDKKRLIVNTSKSINEFTYSFFDCFCD
jgi:hypothetical protein